MTKRPDEPVAASLAPPVQPTRRYRNYVLGILVVVYTMNFLDRNILAILAAPIKDELGLTDTQLGLMHGLAFAVLYSTLGVPIAWLADRSSRRNIMSWALGLWSGFTALCGLATGFWQLFLFRVGVGVGEAGGVAPAYSMVADYFPKHQRARALAVYSLGIPIGSGAGVLAGGLIASKYGWRAAFIAVGVMGLALAPLFRLTVKDPPRGGFDAAGKAAAPVAPAKVGEVFRLVARKRSFWLMAFGAASSSVCGYGLAFWMPAFFQRSFGLTLEERSWIYGGMSLLGGVLGVGGGGILADRLGGGRKAVYALIPAVAYTISVPVYFLAFNAPSILVGFPLYLIPIGLNLMWLGPVLTAVQHLVPAHMRTTASAMFLLINNLFGIAVGSYYFGAVSDALAPRYGAESLRYAIYTGMGFYLVGATLFALASRRLARDWVE